MAKQLEKNIKKFIYKNRTNQRLAKYTNVR